MIDITVLLDPLDPASAVLFERLPVVLQGRTCSVSHVLVQSSPGAPARNADATPLLRLAAAAAPHGSSGLALPGRWIVEAVFQAVRPDASMALAPDRLDALARRLSTLRPPASPEAVEQALARNAAMLASLRVPSLPCIAWDGELHVGTHAGASFERALAAHGGSQAGPRVPEGSG